MPLWLGLSLQRGAEERGEAEEVGEDARGRDFWTSARASDDHWLRVVTRRLKTHYVVAARQACERMIERVSAQARVNTSSTSVQIVTESAPSNAAKMEAERAQLVFQAGDAGVLRV